MDTDIVTDAEPGARADTEPTSPLGVALKTAGIRVPMIAEADAQGPTAAMFEQVKSALGLPFVPDMFRLTSTRPDLLGVVLTGFAGMFAGGVLSRQDKEIIAAWTSKINSCTYCVGTHNWFLLQFGGSQELADAIMNSATVEDLPLAPKYQPLMALVTKVSTAAYKVTDQDWADATAAGWNDAELLEAVFCASLFNFINRLVDATGLGATVQSTISKQPVADEAVS
jgi:uncharacterized peroxidase-related enzyme